MATGTPEGQLSAQSTPFPITLGCFGASAQPHIFWVPGPTPSGRALPGVGLHPAPLPNPILTILQDHTTGLPHSASPHCIPSTRGGIQ